VARLLQRWVMYLLNDLRQLREVIAWCVSFAGFFPLTLAKLGLYPFFELQNSRLVPCNTHLCVFPPSWKLFSAQSNPRCTCSWLCVGPVDNLPPKPRNFFFTLSLFLPSFAVRSSPRIPILDGIGYIQICSACRIFFFNDSDSE
jgi:hypothetical protein